jgi:hypothetical protein
LRKLVQPQMPGVPMNIQSIFNEIFRASQEGDIVDIGGGLHFRLIHRDKDTQCHGADDGEHRRSSRNPHLDLQRGGATKST